MKKVVTVVITVLGFAATVWNTISVEKKSAQLEDTDAIVEAMEQELETRELNYRLAVQEFNFSTLHAASAYDIDSNHKVLGASVAPGTTMLEKREAGGEKKRLSFRDLAKKKAAAAKAKVIKRPTPSASAGPQPRPAKQPSKRVARPAFFANLTELGKPQGAPDPRKTAPRRTRKLPDRVVQAFSPVAERISTARPHVLTPEQRRKVLMIRGFQMENLSRWRQYLHLASTGQPMSEEEVADWEGLLADALVRSKDPSIETFKEQCSTSVHAWEDSYQEGRAALEEETGQKTALEKQIDRSKSVYMGLMLVGLVLVTLKDLFGKSDD